MARTERYPRVSRPPASRGASATVHAPCALPARRHPALALPGDRRPAGPAGAGRQATLLCPTLTYPRARRQAEFMTLRCDLDAEQTARYDAAAELWQVRRADPGSPA